MPDFTSPIMHVGGDEIMFCSLFTDENGNPRKGFEEQAEIVRARESRKRGCYNKAPKPVVTNPYLELQQIQIEIANFFTLPASRTEDSVFFEANNKIVAWIDCYDSQAYTYEGNIYSDDTFHIASAELVGTEEMHITDRLRLHKELIELLRDDVQLEKAVELMQPKIEAIPKREKVEIDRRLIG